MKVNANPFALTNIASFKGHFQDLLTKISASTTAGAEVAQAILNGEARFGEFSLYTARAAQANTTIELMLASDTQETGVTNCNNRKLPTNNYMAVGAIQLQEATIEGSEAITVDNIKGAAFGKISNLTANGDFELKQGTSILLQRQSSEIFRTEGGESRRFVGYHVLETPLLFLPETEIIPILYLPKANNRAVYKIVFHGVKN